MLQRDAEVRESTGFVRVVTVVTATLGIIHGQSLLPDDGRYEALTSVTEECYFMGCDVV
jgi:hypothetical protein